MDFSGKKLARLRLPRQLNVTETMAIEIKLRAEFGYRSIEDELRRLLMLGIKYEDSMLRNDFPSTEPHQGTLFGTGGR